MIEFQDAGLLAAALAVALGALRLGERGFKLAARRVNGNRSAPSNPPPPAMSPCIAAAQHGAKLEHIERILTKTDEHGMPLIYAPSRMVDEVRQSNKLLLKILDKLPGAGS